MEKCINCNNRYVCNGLFEFECIDNGGMHYRVDTLKPTKQKEVCEKVPQVKMFSCRGDVTEEINEWLINNRYIELIDVKFSVTENWNCALVIYNTYINGEKQ